MYFLENSLKLFVFRFLICFCVHAPAKSLEKIVPGFDYLQCFVLFFPFFSLSMAPLDLAARQAKKRDAGWEPC